MILNQPHDINRQIPLFIREELTNSALWHKSVVLVLE